MTAILDSVADVVEEQEEVYSPGPVSDRQIYMQICFEAASAGLAVSLDEAAAFVVFLNEAAMYMRLHAKKHGCTTAEFPYHVIDDHLERFHALMLIIMPDEAVAQPGTAHDLINRRICSGDERGLRHTIDGDEIVYCAVMIDMCMDGLLA